MEKILKTTGENLGYFIDGDNINVNGNNSSIINRIGTCAKIYKKT
jgi:hypothetical protein